MKTMNFLFTMVFALVIGACTNENQTEELSSVDYKASKYEEKEENQEEEETQEVFELDIRQNFILGKLAMLEAKNKKLKEEIEEGNKSLIPVLESNSKLIDLFARYFKTTRALRCHFLGVKADMLAEQASKGDKDAERELEAMDEALRSCNTYVSYYPVNLSKYAAVSIGRKKTVGGCSEPTPDSYGSCKIGIDFGRKEIVLGEDISLVVLDKKGNVVSKPRFKEEHELDGLSIFEIDLPQDDYIIKVTTDYMEYTLSGGGGI